MPTDTLGFEIAETALSLRRSFDRRAAKLGVTRAQWRVMLRLSVHPSLRQVELADMLDIEPITLCRIVDRLEEAGLVERQPDPADRRARRLILTPQAAPLLERLRSIATDLGDEAFAGLSQSQIEMLRASLERIRNNLSRPAAVSPSTANLTKASA